MIKNTDGQPDEEIHITRFGKVLSAGASILVELGVHYPPSVDVFTNVEALCTFYDWDFGEASSCRHDESLTPFSAPPLSLENEG